MGLYKFKRTERNPIKADNQLIKGLKLLAYGKVRQDSNSKDRSEKLSGVSTLIKQRPRT